MHITCDPVKNQRNIIERDLSFDRAAEFDFETARIHVDHRLSYSETRYVALGWLQGRLHVLCFAEEAQGIRVISFRKANSREVSSYAKVKNTD